MSEPALIAAGQAAHAVAALLEHARDREGFGDEPVVEMLAEALVHAIAIRLRYCEPCDTEFNAALTGLSSTCATFIEGWAG
jgi:alkylation response protein AidB-like acyl-CoA dehydrogenase